MNMNRSLRLVVFLCVLAVVFSDGRVAVDTIQNGLLSFFLTLSVLLLSISF